MKHSPLPFQSGPLGVGERHVILCGDTEKSTIAECFTEANAAYIVRACNCHPKLVGFVREFAWEDTDNYPDAPDETGLLFKARALLAELEGGE
jgi:hypothetical protein